MTEPTIVTKARLAEIFDISLPTVDAWLRRGLPYERQGANGEPWAFDLRECIRWREQDIVDKKVNDNPVAYQSTKQGIIERRPHLQNYLRAHADDAGLNLLNYQVRYLPSIMTILHDKGLSKSKSYDAVVEIYLILSHSYVAWIVNDVFNIEALDGEIDQIWRMISNRIVATRPPDNEDDIELLPPPDWLRMKPGEFVKRYWKGRKPDIPE